MDRLLSAARCATLLAGGAALGICAAAAAADPDAVAPASHVAEPGRDGEGAFDQARLVRELMKRRGGEPAAAAQLLQMSRDVPAAEAAAMFDELATAHQAAGAINLAAETRLMLIQRYPEQPLASQALLWLTRLYGSSEVAHMHRPAGQTAGAELDRADRALALYGYELAGGAQASPERETDPALTFARAAAARRAGLLKSAISLCSSLKRRRAGDPWGDCARVEDWLADPRDASPAKPVARIAAARTPPNLDGALDELFWQSSDGLPVGDPSDGAAVVMLAYDEQYLYVGATCPRRDGVDYAASSAARPHDADLSACDRVRVSIDADRDYATAYELTIDSRGWTAERCWDDAAWNPDWYVAAGGANSSGNSAWTIEAAIPWSALAARPPHSGAAWAIAIERFTPGAEAQSWTAAATDGGPERFGVLAFQ